MFDIYTSILDQLLCAFDTQKEQQFEIRRCGETEFIVSAYVNTLLKEIQIKKYPSIVCMFRYNYNI